MGAEVRSVLEAAINPEGRIKLGSLLAEMGQKARPSNDQFVVFEQVRDRAPFQAAGVAVIDPSTFGV